MFQIESQDDPSFGFRVMIIQTTFRSVVRIQQKSGNTYQTQAEREFRRLEDAQGAYDTQRRLLTCCAKSRGDKYVIRENASIARPQLQLEIAA